MIDSQSGGRSMSQLRQYQQKVFSNRLNPELLEASKQNLNFLKSLNSNS